MIKEKDVPTILADDGVDLFIGDMANQDVMHIPAVLKRVSSMSMAVTVVNTHSNSATLIRQYPGEGNRRHYHEDWDEWWYILGGAWKFVTDDGEKIVLEGDLVLIKRGTWHRIEAVGDGPATRLAVSRYDVNHIYEEEDENSVSDTTDAG